MAIGEGSGTGTWTVAEGRLADGVSMRVYLASRAGLLWGAGLSDHVHPRGEDEFLWSLGCGLSWVRSEEGLAESISQVQDYFAGHRQTFDLLVSLRGTGFQRRVWQHLMEIPYAGTISYGELAGRIGQPGAARAVGNANGRNKLGLIVPCHRVLAAGGKLGGYTGGLGLKRRLLAHEAAVASRTCAA